MYRYNVPIYLQRMASSSSKLLVSATVPTGLEFCAADECREVMGKKPVYSRGSITVELDHVEQLQQAGHVTPSFFAPLPLIGGCAHTHTHGIGGYPEIS